jgi:hypothetical protein
MTLDMVRKSLVVLYVALAVSVGVLYVVQPVVAYLSSDPYWPELLLRVFHYALIALISSGIATVYLIFAPRFRTPRAEAVLARMRDTSDDKQTTRVATIALFVCMAAVFIAQKWFIHDPKLSALVSDESLVVVVIGFFLWVLIRARHRHQKKKALPQTRD